MLKNREIDMLHGTLWDKIIIFALPLALTGVMQQLLNTADRRQKRNGSCRK